MNIVLLFYGHIFDSMIDEKETIIYRQLFGSRTQSFAVG